MNAYKVITLITICITFINFGMIKTLKYFVLLLIFFSNRFVYAEYTLTEQTGYIATSITTDSVQSRLYFQQGKNKYKAREYALAIDYFTKAIESDQNNGTAYEYRGLSYSKIDDYIKAIDDYSKAILLSPKDPYLLIYRGNAYASIEKHAKALEDLSKSIELAPTLMMGYGSRGNVKMIMRKYSEAIEDFSSAIKYGPSYVDNYIDRGVCKKHLKDYKGSMDDFSMAIFFEWKNERAYFNRGLLEMDLLQYEDAIKDFNICIKLNPTSSTCYYRRGMCYEELLNYSSALDDFNKSITLKETYNTFIERGKVKVFLNDYKGALADFKNCERVAPDKRDALYYFTLGSIYVGLLEYSEALKAYNTSLAIAENGLTFTRRGIVKLYQKDYKGAEADFKRSNEIYPSATAYSGLTSIYLDKKDYTKALEYCNRAIVLDSTSVLACTDLSVIKINLGDEAGALIACNKALDLDSVNVSALLIKSFITKGNIPGLDKVIQLEPDNANAYNLRGGAEIIEGDFEKALFDYNKLIELLPDNAMAYSTRGGIKFLMNNNAGCFADINKAIALDPTNPKYYYERGIFRMDDLTVTTESLIKDFTKAIELNKNYGNAYYFRALIKLRSGDKEGACIDMKMALKLNVAAAKNEIMNCCAP